MKHKHIIILSIVIIVSHCLYDFRCSAIHKNKLLQVGEYSLNIEKSDLGEYASDIAILKNLRLTFYKNGTFYFNMKPPFILDSIGRWNAPDNDPEHWYWIWYGKWGYEDYEKDRGNQFDGSRYNISEMNIIFYPDDGQKSTGRLYFNKVQNFDE